MRVADPENTIQQQVQLLQILRGGAQTRRSLSEQTGYSISLIRQLTQDLVGRGLLVESGVTAPDTPGRPSQVWSLSPSACLAVGLDVGGAHTRIVILDTFGRILYKHVEPTPHDESSAAFLDHLARLVDSALDSLGELRVHVRGLGVAFSGFIDYRGFSLDAPNIASAQQLLPLQDYLRDALDLPTMVDDSTRAMTLAEMRYGVARNSDNFVCVNVGAGIGTGIIIDRKLYRGAFNLAGELGHIPVMLHGERCRCGGYGCLETLASGSAVAARAQLMLEQGVPSQLHALCGHDAARVTSEMVTRAALDGDRLALDVLGDAGAWLGMGLGIVVNLFSPDMVVLTGGVMRHNTLLLSIVRDAAHRYILQQLPYDFPIVLTGLDEQSGALGAATFVLDAEFEHGFARRLAKGIIVT